MRDLLAPLDAWAAQDTPFALARVTQTWRSAPRPVGAALAVRPDLQLVGSVSGGCIEGAVVEVAQEVLATGAPQRCSYGVDNETAWSVGLTCGGAVTVFVEPFFPFAPAPAAAVWQRLRAAFGAHEPAVLATRLLTDAKAPRHLLAFPETGERVGGWDGDLALQEAIHAAYQDRESRVVEGPEAPCFLHVFPRPDRLLIIGAAHLTVALVRLAHGLGFETIVVDPRRVFADPARFDPAPDQLLNAWPQDAFDDLDLHGDTYAVLLSHDPKIDAPAMHRLLRSPVKYIGALGSRRTQARRRERLQAAGFTDDEVTRIHGPVGLAIGAQTPEEIALSILAEIVAVRRGQPLD